MVDDQQVRAALGALVEDWEAGPELRERVVEKVGQRRAHRRRAVVAVVAVVGVAAIAVAQLSDGGDGDDGLVVAGEGDGADSEPAAPETPPPSPDEAETSTPPAQPEIDAMDLPVVSLDELDVDVAVVGWDSGRVTIRHGGETRELAGLPGLGSGDHPYEAYPDTDGGVVYQPSGEHVEGIWHLAAGADNPDLLVPPPADPSGRLRLAGTADLNGTPYVLYATGRASSIFDDEGEQLIRASLDGSHTGAWLDDAGFAWEGGVRAARVADGWTSLWRSDSTLEQIWRFTPGADFGSEPPFGSPPIFENEDGDPVRLVDFDMVTARESGLLTVVLTVSGPDERFAHPSALRIDVGTGAGTTSRHLDVPSGAADVIAYAVSTNGSHVVVSRRGGEGPVQPLVYDMQDATWSRIDVTGMVRLVPPPTTVAS